MADEISTEIIVKRRVRGGLYVYTCDELPGLFVASRTDQVAYNDVPVSIQLLMKLDLGMDTTVTHKISYGEFIKQMRLSERAREELSARTDSMMMDDDNIERLAFAVHSRGRNTYAQ